MFNMGLSELILIAVVAVPGLILTFGPLVLAIVIWQRQTELRRRVERLESALPRQPGG